MQQAAQTDGGQSQAETTVPVFSVANGVATIRLNRPSVHNRLEPADLRELNVLFDRIESDRSIRVLVLTGTGSKTFSSGFHLGALEDRANAKPDPSSDARDNVFGDMVTKLENLRVPTICRLNGGVYGGSTDLALACDFRLGDGTVQMFMPAAKIGLHYYESGMVRYVTRLGLNAAKTLFLTARKLSAAEMYRVGYLTTLCETGDLDHTVDDLVADLLRMAPLSLTGMKKALNDIARGALDSADFARRAKLCADSDDLKEGLRAFHEKRPPKFSGS